MSGWREHATRDYGEPPRPRRKGRWATIPIHREILNAVDQERRAMSLPTNSSERKQVPLVTGVLDYFPDALAAVAKVSKAGNDKHNPGSPLHHSRGKSTDHADSLLRHLVDRGKMDPDTGQRHSAEVAWRALALLQQEIEDQEGAPLPRGAEAPDPIEVQLNEQTPILDFDSRGAQAGVVRAFGIEVGD